MIVKRISPKELTADLIFRLNYLYHAEQGEFIAIADSKGETLLVNQKVPEKDIDGFLGVVTFPEYWVNDDELGKGQFLDYVYHKYGSHTHEALCDAHKQQIERKERARAEAAAKAIIPLIEREVNSETPVVKYDELLAYEIWKYGFHLNKSTPKHKTDYGSVYTFYFGYLLGVGLLKGGATE